MRHDHRSCAQCVITDVIQVLGWVQIVGTSGNVRTERTNVTQVVRKWRCHQVSLHLRLDASAHGATCLIQRCARHAPSVIAVVEAQSFHARARVRDSTTSI